MGISVDENNYEYRRIKSLEECNAFLASVLKYDKSSFDYYFQEKDGTRTIFGRDFENYCGFKVKVKKISNENFEKFGLGEFFDCYILPVSLPEAFFEKTLKEKLERVLDED